MLQKEQEMFWNENYSKLNGKSWKRDQIMALDLNYFFKIFVAYPGLVQPIVILPCLFWSFIAFS